MGALDEWAAAATEADFEADLAYAQTRDPLDWDGPTVFYIARCQACDIKVPFGDEHERDRWATGHSQAPHDTALAPIPAGVVRGGAFVTTWKEQR